MAREVHGIHHVTAIAGDPQANVDFYVGVLGLRLVKKTVNFDDPGTYHFYYGDDSGNPGTILTFFPWAGAPKGRPGNGQLTVTSFSIPENAMGYWAERLKKLRVDYRGPFSRFDEEVVSLHDPDGLQLELTSAVGETRPGWRNGFIPPEYAIRGFFGVQLAEEGYERTAGLMTATLGFRSVREQGNRFRYESGAGGAGTYVDLLCQPAGRHGVMGVGVVHHVAWRTPNADAQLELRREIARLGYNASPVMDRSYFRSIYFREPGGVLFEVATDPPGFAIDESPENLGAGLKLPFWLEKERATIERILPPITVPEDGI
jgi:catechol 2,3-dioxygenase-like lactoylglutathione lyase family enzyme